MDRPERVLVIGAHPDDVDFGAAGTVANWTDAGVEVHYCLVTDGQTGGFDESIPRDQMAGIRRNEQRAAAQVLGVKECWFLGYVDGELEVSLALRRDLTRVIRQVRPDLVVCQSPVRNLGSIYASHPDHLAAGEAALCAVYPDARNPFAHPALLEDEELEPHVVPEVWLMAHDGSDRYVDITEQFDRKVQALLAHESQHPDPDGLPVRLRAWNERNAAEGGLPDGHVAEAFRILDTR